MHEVSGEPANPSAKVPSGAPSVSALADAPSGQRLRVLRLQAPAGGGAEGWQQQLADLGFTPGETAMVMRRGWPSGDPLAVRIGSSTFALRRAEAACVRVEPLA